MPEQPVRLEGFKTGIDGVAWIIKTVTHNITDSGFTTSIELELKSDEEDKRVKKVEN